MLGVHFTRCVAQTQNIINSVELGFLQVGLDIVIFSISNVKPIMKIFIHQKQTLNNQKVMFKDKFTSIFFKTIFLGILAVLIGCGDKSESPNSKDKKDSTSATNSVRYLGQRLLDLTLPDAKIPPMPNSLIDEFKECKFQKDEENNQTETKECSISNLSPSYKQRQQETINIVADTPRCCLTSVAVYTNQLTYDNTLDLFEGLPGVKKTPVACSNIEADYGRKEFYVISRDGIDKLVVEEHTDGGSGGSNTTSTIYYGMPKIECDRIEKLEKQRMDKIREANLKNNAASTNKSTTTATNQDLQGKGLIGDFQCRYTAMIAVSTGAAVEMKGRQTHTFKLEGAFGTHTSTNSSEKIKFVSTNTGPAGTGYLYKPVTPGEVPFEYQINIEKTGAIGGLMIVKNSPIGEVMAIGSCQKI